MGFINATLGGVTWRRWGMLVGSRAFGGKPDVNEQNNVTCVVVGLPVLFPTLLLLLCPRKQIDCCCMAVVSMCITCDLQTTCCLLAQVIH